MRCVSYHIGRGVLCFRYGRVLALRAPLVCSSCPLVSVSLPAHRYGCAFGWAHVVRVRCCNSLVSWATTGLVATASAKAVRPRNDFGRVAVCLFGERAAATHQVEIPRWKIDRSSCFVRLLVYVPPSVCCGGRRRRLRLMLLVVKICWQWIFMWSNEITKLRMS